MESRGRTGVLASLWGRGCLPACIRGSPPGTELGGVRQAVPTGQGQSWSPRTPGRLLTDMQPPRMLIQRDPRAAPPVSMGSSLQASGVQLQQTRPEPCPQLTDVSGSWPTSHCRIHPRGTPAVYRNPKPAPLPFAQSLMFRDLPPISVSEMFPENFLTPGQETSQEGVWAPYPRGIKLSL